MLGLQKITLRFEQGRDDDGLGGEIPRDGEDGAGDHDAY